MADRIYVTGHVNPDTDSIAAAMGYAWCLRERDNVEALATRAGPYNPQTTWLLKRLELEGPTLMTDASPRFESVVKRLDTTYPDQSLRDAWSILTRTGGVTPVIDQDGKPFGIINGVSLFDFLAKSIGPNPRAEELKLSALLDIPCRDAADTGAPRFQANAYIRDWLNRILRDQYNDFFVIDESGQYIGICHQRDVLNPPRIKVVLVDHNEPRQSIGALEEAELLEILDHHRLGNPYTHTPIRFTVDVVGSTSTLVSEKIAEAGLSAPPKIAGVLLGGLLSDTLILASPTTTQRDRQAAERLARWAFVGNSPLHGETIKSFGKALLASGAGLENRDPKAVVSSDMKTYESGGYRFAVAQVEVTDLMQLDEHLPALNEALDQLRASQTFHFTMLLITDVVRSSSRLLISNPPPELDDLPYPPLPDGTRQADGVVSRKKQLLPAVLGLLEK
jgi:manganese-dependent inorganic pyrophosphatase